MNKVWCVFIQFTSDRVLYMPSLESAGHGYKIGGLYATHKYDSGLHQLKMFTTAPTAEDAVENAQNRLRELVA